MAKHSILIHTLILFVCCSICATYSFAEVSVDGSISHSTFPLDRAAMLTITVSGASKTAAIYLPEVENIRFHSRGQSSQISMVNGNVTSMVSYNYLVQGLKPGNYTIDPIKVKVERNQFATQPIDFEITATGQQSKTQQQQTSLKDIAFIKVSTLADHYPGEVEPVTLKVYLDQRYRTDITTLPILNGDGVVMEQLSTKPSQSQETLNGRTFHVITWETTLSGIKTGRHPISFSLEGSLLIPQKRRTTSTFSSFGRSSLFNDSLFDDFFGNYRREQVTITSPDLTFNVVALPSENVPENFTGAIGDFNLEVSATPLQVEVGEPITLTVKITGSGNFDRIEALDFPAGDSWKTYSPSSTFEPDESSPYRGVKTFEQAIVVKGDNISEIPKLALSYFDPTQKEYVTKLSAPIGLDVASSSPQVAMKIVKIQPTQPNQELASDATPNYNGLAPLHIHIGKLTHDIKPLFQKPWYIATCLFLTLLTFLAVIVKFRQVQRLKHPEIETSKQTRLQLQTDLAQLQNMVTENDSAAFLAQCRKTIQNKLGKKYQRQPASISSVDLNRWLEANSVIIEIFLHTEQAVYGSATLSKEEMQSMYQQLKDSLEKTS